jgi:hypothetical protein
MTILDIHVVWPDKQTEQYIGTQASSTVQWIIFKSLMYIINNSRWTTVAQDQNHMHKSYSSSSNLGISEDLIINITLLLLVEWRSVPSTSQGQRNKHFILQVNSASRLAHCISFDVHSWGTISLLVIGVGRYHYNLTMMENKAVIGYHGVRW